MYAKGAVPAFAILDSRALDYYSWGPVIAGKSRQPFIDNGYLTVDDTVEGLARKVGIDPAGFADEVKRFNHFAETGVDEDFKRGASHHNRAMGDPNVTPNPSLGKIEKRPFYAVRIWPLDVGTSGGLVTDEYSRVLREDGSLIARLFAAGYNTGAVGGQYDPGAGASIGGGIAFGYVAARHAMSSNEVGAAQAA
jgi:3-oxosteroid 1-dehydrogenase